MDCQCSCGHVHYSVKGPGLLRGYCHCTICQSFNQSAYADITIFKASNVTLPDDAQVDYQAYKKIPPAVQRGKCVKCGSPAIERMKLPLLPELVIVPSGNAQAQAALPDASLHIFYHRRVKEIDDSLPKYEGFLSSQWAFASRLLAALARR